ncbi:MAG TPA: NUDIX domain-containing protein [Pseudomonadales bacterium]
MEPLTRGNIRLAATIVLLREGPDGPEVFMMKRPGVGDFPDLHVFPGGKLDEADFAPELLQGLDAGTADRLLGVAGGGLRYWVAAIRECFEECGVLLAYRDGAPLSWANEGEIARFDGYRQELIDGRISLLEVCRREGLRLAADRVRYFSHWITPAVVPRRFDTRFFVAAMPEDQTTIAHHWETADDEWVRPRAALEAHRAGRWQMISPTLTTLDTLARFDDVSSILAAVDAETHLPPLTDELARQGMHPLR